MTKYVKLEDVCKMLKEIGRLGNGFAEAIKLLREKLEELETYSVPMWIQNTGKVPDGLKEGRQIIVKYKDGDTDTWVVGDYLLEDVDFWEVRGIAADIVEWRYIP